LMLEMQDTYRLQIQLITLSLPTLAEVKLGEVDVGL
jgi:hypothetical protein